MKKSNQILFKLNALKLTTRMSVDQFIKDFLELRADLKSFHEGRMPSTHISKFLDNISDLKFDEDDRDLVRNGSLLDEFMKNVRCTQRKTKLDQERNRSSSVIPFNDL